MLGKQFIDSLISGWQGSLLGTSFRVFISVVVMLSFRRMMDAYCTKFSSLQLDSPFFPPVENSSKPSFIKKMTWMSN